MIIEKGIKIYSHKSLPLMEMDVSDSFVYGPYSRAKMVSLATRIRAHSNLHHDGVRAYSCRKVKEGGEFMLRVWRIENRTELEMAEIAFKKKERDAAK
ncbi:MAG: hypothetical protein ACI9P5_004803 [Saprospiraceae bacterium]|jgi:hypothetical protein|tara:strand:- start:360 stop:653 length:294 start_codon:yes stop_codon:yes gene_type:complete